MPQSRTALGTLWSGIDFPRPTCFRFFALPRRAPEPLESEEDMNDWMTSIETRDGC